MIKYEFHQLLKILSILDWLLHRGKTFIYYLSSCYDCFLFFMLVAYQYLFLSNHFV